MIENGRINWENVQRGLRDSQARLEAAFARTPEETALVLEERAAHLAHRASARLPEATRAVLILRAGKHLAGINAADARAVNLLKSWAPVPGCAQGILGVASFQNEFFNLVDLPWAMGDPMAAEGSSSYAQAVVLRNLPLKIALACEEVCRLEYLPLTAFDADGIFQTGDQYGAMFNIHDIPHRLSA